MKIHFIAIGGSAMHNLAIALHQRGVQVTGSDDEIFEPSKSRLEKHNLLPPTEGWAPDRINKDTDAVVLGMHAREDNPELQKARNLGIKIYSYPEYLYEHAKNKLRIVVGGSHGKTTITAMIMHVFRHCNLDFDYMVGAQLEGFDIMVGLSENAPVMVMEGDEYLTSPIDRRPKFHLYHPNIAIISGIGWDHINVFPTYEDYLEQFRIFINKITPGGTLIYCEDDVELTRIVDQQKKENEINIIGYGIPRAEIKDGITYLKTNAGNTPLAIFGNHNLYNLNAARLACMEAGISESDFYQAISSFKGAGRRLELLEKNKSCAVFQDFAHSPSKLKATIEAVKTQFSERTLFACIELHTFSSLNENFLNEYSDAMKPADIPVVYFNPHVSEMKKLPPLNEQVIKRAFNDKRIIVIQDSTKLEDIALRSGTKNSVFLFMSSGNFDGLRLEKLTQKILNQQNLNHKKGQS